MHIMVVPSWYSSPSNKVHGSFFREQFQALQRSGEKVSIAYNEIWPINRIGRIGEKRGMHFKVEDGLKTYRYKDYNFLPKNANMFKIFNRRMEKLFLKIVEEEGKIDVIHAHSAFWGGISAAYVANKYNIPFVLTEHTSLKNSKYVKESYFKWIKYAYDSADKLIAVGNGLKDEINKYTSNDVEVIHNLVDFSMFTPIDNKQDKVEIFSLAYLVKGKGMDLLLKGFSEAFKNENVYLRIGGDGAERGALEELSKELGIETQVTFLGGLGRKEVVSEMNRCSGFVLASEHETFGVVYIEALSLGKPVLGTKNGGAEDIIKDYNGVIVENRNHRELVKGLRYFVDNISKFDSELIRKECISNYGEEVIIDKIKNVYKEII